jgi:hypothetical protein
MVIPPVLGLGAVMLLILPALAAAQIPPNAVEVRIDSVLAADTNQGTDERLQAISRQLSDLFRYTTYRLLSHQESRTHLGEHVAFTLPGGRILHVEPRTLEHHMIAMEVIMFEGERPMMATDLKLMNRGVFLVGGHRYEDGMLIISIGAEMPEAPVSTETAVHKTTPAAHPASATPADNR